MRNLDFLRLMPPGVTLQEVGARLYEALSDVGAQQKTIAQQTNANPTGQPLPPPAIDGLTVTGQNGHFHLQIQHGGEFYRGVNYHAEYADNPSFQKPHAIDMGASREHTVSLGNGTYYWRAFAAYGSSAAGPPAYHGGAHSPQPVAGGGFVGGPAFLDPQGSGTGEPGEGLSGPGPIPFRTSTGRPPIRGESTASGGSSGGALAPSPQTGLPAGMASLGTPAGGSTQAPLILDIGALPAESQLKLKAGGLGCVDLICYSASVGEFTIGAEWTGSAWVARDPVVVQIVKTNGGLFEIRGSTGNTLGAVAVFNPWLVINPATGKCGFGGNTTPGYPVDVTGDANASGVYRVAGVPGVSGTQAVGVSLSVGTMTIQYKDWAGSNQSVTIVTSVALNTYAMTWAGGIRTA